MKKVKQLEWIRNGDFAETKNKTKVYDHFLKTIIGYYKYRKIGKEYFLKGAKDDVVNKKFKSTKEAENFAQRHYAERVAEMLQELSFMWVNKQEIALPGDRFAEMVSSLLLMDNAVNVYHIKKINDTYIICNAGGNEMSFSKSYEEAKKKAEELYRNDIVNFFYE